jgi:F-box/leucine-rich repeat protein 4
MVVRTYGQWWQTCPSAAKLIEGSTFRYRDFIELEYSDPVIPTAIEIFETYNPGGVVRILALPVAGKDSSCRWQVLWEGPVVTGLPDKARCFKPELRAVKFHTNLIRLELDSETLNYYAEIDAVKMVGYQTTEDHAVAVNAADDATMSANALLYRVLSGARRGHSRGGSFSAAAVTDGEADGGDSSDGGGAGAADGNVLEAGSFDMLPDELLLDILETFLTPALLALGRVCRRFYWAVTTTMRFRTKVDLKPHYESVTDSALRYLAPKLDSVKELSLSWIGSTAPFDLVTGAGLEEVAKVVGAQLTTLRLACCSIVTDDVLAQICARCVNLVELDVQRCEGLTRKAFHYIGGLKHLERLNLYSTFIRAEGLLSICEGCGPSLKHIDLGHCNHLQKSPEAASLVPIATHCPNLVSLCLWFNR